MNQPLNTISNSEHAYFPLSVPEATHFFQNRNSAAINLCTTLKNTLFHSKYKAVSLIPSLLVCLSLWFIHPLDGLTKTGMHVLSVFLAFVIALLLSNYEVSVLVASTLSFLALSLNLKCKLKNNDLIDCHLCSGAEHHCSPYKSAFEVVISGFSKNLVWLVFCAFQIGKAVEVSGLGRRIALHLLTFTGKTLKGLAFSFCLAEFVLAPFIPSNSARGGGVIMPIVTSVIKILKEQNHSSASTNAYLILVAAQANLISSSMFLTGLAANPLVSTKAQYTLDVQFGFIEWLTGGFVPGLFAFVGLPFFLHWIIKPQNYKSKEMINTVNNEIYDMGGISTREWKLITILIMCLTFWSTEKYTQLDNSLIAFVALVTMVLTNVLKWEEIIKNTKSWDTLFWLSGFIVIAEQLTELKVADWLGRQASVFLESYRIGPISSCIILSLVYFFSMSMFSSATGHIVALTASIFEAGERLGSPKMLLVGLIAYFSALSCCTTTYSTGSFSVYFGQGYVNRTQWFKVGALMACYYIIVYFSVGLSWWKFIGWF